MSDNNIIIETPHAAIKVWNYVDRITDTGAKAQYANKVEEHIISTVSLTNIQTNKVKGNPVGTFNFILAPTRNWVSVLTPGSWCVIMMGNEPITEEAFKKADPALVKMFGRIDTVRVDVGVDGDGARRTRYYVSGEDWGSMFNNVLYVDPLIQDSSEQSGQQSNMLYVQFMNAIFGEKGVPSDFRIPTNLRTLMSILGNGPQGIPDSNRLPKPSHRIAIPTEAARYFGFIDGKKKPTDTPDLTKIVNLQTGSLNGAEDSYDEYVNEGRGWLNPFSCVGTHSLWSILMDNSNYALNEMYTDMRWFNDKPQLTLFNRIKPFSFQKNPVANIDAGLRSKFQNIATHRLHDRTIVSVNAGTNWRDKFNFAEIKIDASEFGLTNTITKQKSQAYQKANKAGGAATDVFDREGFKPIIFSVKQLPFKSDEDITEETLDQFDPDLMNKWVNIMQEWYFDSHRLLNGSVKMTGVSEYIPVGDNIMFDAGLVGVDPNYNGDAVKSKNPCYVLAHVESISHTFSVTSDGAREYETHINFVRGIIVDENKNLIGEGTIDDLSTDLGKEDSKNSITVYKHIGPDAPSITKKSN